MRAAGRFAPSGLDLAARICSPLIERIRYFDVTSCAALRLSLLRLAYIASKSSLISVAERMSETNFATRIGSFRQERFSYPFRII